MEEKEKEVEEKEKEVKKKEKEVEEWNGMENLPARRERMTSFDFGSDMVQTIFDDDPEI